MTAKPPRCSTSTLVRNNYDQTDPTARHAAKVDSYIRVDADRVSAQNGRNALHRDVWKVAGPVDLKQANAKLGTRNNYFD